MTFQTPTNQVKTKLSKVIAPCFYPVHNAIKKRKFTIYDLSGGRGSTKSSVVSAEIVDGMMKDRAKGIYTHATVTRMVANTLRGSVFEQIKWAVHKLKADAYWLFHTSPLEAIYMPMSKYPQYIKFFGADDPGKIKSTKFSYGYPKYNWFEEVQQFKSNGDLTTIILSLLRKDDEDDDTSSDDEDFLIFKTGNPDPSRSHWWNIERQYQRSDRLCFHNDYTMIPQEWLTAAFLREAEEMKKRNFKEYQNVFLGLVVGTDGLCYPMFNVNKHVVDVEEFEFFYGEKIYQVICGCDGGTINDATTLIPMLVTTAGRIVVLPTFYYDPQDLNHEPIANSIQVKLMELWLDAWSMCYLHQDIQEITTIVVDSAAQDLVLSFNLKTKYKAIKVPGKDILIDMKRHQDALTVPNYIKIVNAGYIDPVTLSIENGQMSYEKVHDYDMYIQEVETLVMDEKTNKPVDKDNHTIDGFNYGLHVATQLSN